MFRHPERANVITRESEQQTEGKNADVEGEGSIEVSSRNGSRNGAPEREMGAREEEESGN